MNPGPIIVYLLRSEVYKADCRRRSVGCVLVLDGVIVGKGHNALPDGSCIEGDCPRGRMSYEEQPADVGYEASGCVAVHAEDMALVKAGERAVGAIAYITEWPCPRCESRLKDAGVIGFIRTNVRPEIPAIFAGADVQSRNDSN